jgi:membrane-associated phospholipid phosphatase
MTFRRRLLQLDAQYSQRLSIAENPGLLQNLARFFAHSGDSWFWILGLAVLWLVGNDFWKLRAEIMASGIVLTAIVVFSIKFVVRRQRPEGEWGAIYRKTDPHSFPSGHSTRALMLAVIAVGLGPAWFGFVLAIWAPLVVLARVAMGVHYLSDVVAGAVLGVVIGFIILKSAFLFLP